MVLNPRKCEFMNFGKSNENVVFTYHEIRPKKLLRKLLEITTNYHIIFNEQSTNIYKSASRKLIVLSRESTLLSYQQKKIPLRSFIRGEIDYCPLIWIFSSIWFHKKINKLRERYLQLCQIVASQAMANIWANKV